MDLNIWKSIGRHYRKLEREKRKEDKKIITTFDKAIVALLVPLLVFLLGHYGLKVDDTYSTSLTTVLTPLIVWLVPNKS